MRKWRCKVCGYEYDEEKGENLTGTPTGTEFGSLPEDWVCPVCGASKDEFEEIRPLEEIKDIEGTDIWRCSVCGYEYKEEKGEPATGTPPETRFLDLPDGWVCPVCGTKKEVFSRMPRLEMIHDLADTTVSDVLVSEMENWGINLVFGLPGTSSLGLVDAVRKNKNMHYILVRHEENAAMAASAYNKLTGKIAACLTIAGPGATNLSTGLYDAKEDHASVLSINGQVATQYTGPGGFQEIDQDAFFKPISVYNNTIYDKKMAVLLLTKAIKFAKIHRGVAQLSVPNDIQKEHLNSPISRRETVVGDLKIIPGDGAIREAAGAINAAEHPLIIAGWGAFDSAEEVVALSEIISAPIVTTYRAKGILPDNHKRMVGILGSVGSPHARRLAEESDLIITLGVGYSKYTNVPLNKKIVQVDIDPVKLGQNQHTIPLWGNCGVTISKLTGKLKKKESNGILERISEMKLEWDEHRDREADPHAAPLRPPYIMKVLSDTIPEDAVIALDVGENHWWFGRNFRMKRQRFAMSGYLGTMGFGLPGAIAGKLAFPDKTVFCITGDGGFTMAMADFITAVRYELPMVVVILNNHQLAMIQVEQMMEQYPNYATELLNPDFAEYAEACGGAGISVKKPEELEDAIRMAMDLEKPVIVDVDTDPGRFA